MISPSSNPELTIALPAYEEAANLEVLLPRLKAVLDGFGTGYEIVVADTEQPHDDTPAVCARHGAVYLARVGGSLYSHAVTTALNASRGEWVVFMDADGSHSPEFIEKLWAERNNADLVIASRYMPGGRTENPPILVFMSLVVNVIFRVILGLRCADVSNSFRLYKGEDLRALTLECENFDIVEEILVKLCCADSSYVVKEIPFFFEKRKAGKTKRNLVTFAVSYIGTLFRLARLKREALKANKRSS
jgi:dolichol-phosphate mannosyltransferase